jgi:metallo-beta-lactamase class B
LKSNVSGPAFATALALIPLANVAAQDAPTTAPRVRPPASSYVKPTTWPDENKAAVIEHMSLARKAAGGDLFGDFAHRCIISPNYRTRISGIQHNGYLPPTKIFDNLYSVGQNAVSAHAVVTSAGIVLFDTLNSEDEAKNILVPNLIKAGLDPKTIKYIVVTHAHGDHYGGAKYLQETYGARVISSKIDWDAMDAQGARTGGPFGPTPKRDMVVEDGQAVKIGDETFTFYVSPGHTEGAVSTIFKVKQGSAAHTVGYFGGTGGASGRADSLRAQINSLERWRRLTQAAGVDTLIANHPLHDRGIENNEILNYLKPGDPNPYVLGSGAYQRYMMVQEECAKIGLARLGFTQ